VFIAHRRIVSVLTIATALLVGVPSALAQRPRPDREYRGLFGGNGADPKSNQAFDMSVSLYGGYDDNVLADQQQGGYTDPRFQVPSGYGAASLSLDYSKRTGRVTFDFSGGTEYRYYGNVKEMTGFNWYGTAGFSAKLSSRTDFRATESASYTPYYSFAPFPGLSPPVPGDIAPISPDYPLLQQAATYYNSMASFEHRLTPRSSIRADYFWSGVDYSNASQQYRNWNAGAGYSYKLTSHASARLGYHYRKSVSSYYYQGQPITAHDIDVGIDYNRALSFSRKTTFGFSFGTSIYKSFAPISADVTVPWQNQTHYVGTGNVFLNYQIGRSWNARLDYRRGLDYIMGFTDPFQSNVATASIGGFISPRQRFNAAASYNKGNVGVGYAGRNYDTYMAMANYQMALAKWGALFADYGYYHYVFDNTVPMPPGMYHGQDRQSVRGGVNLWLPLLR
jgi:hypothetical protein